MRRNTVRKPNPDADRSERTRKRRRAERLGRWAEMAAVVLLTLKGYRILAQRARTPLGEIDLIARRGRTVVFIEVKARPRRQDTLLAVTQKQQGRIIRAAEWYRAGNRGLADCDMRFDMIGVAPRRLPMHVVDAFRP